MDKDKVNSFFDAVEAGDEAAVQQCLDDGADVDYCLYDYTALNMCIFFYGDISMTRLLLDRNANPNLQNSKGRTPLHKAISCDVKIMALLLERGANPNLQDRRGQAPLHYVGTAEIAALLLDHGADGNLQDKYGQTPLHLAAERNCLEVAQLFVNRNVNINIETDLLLETPLHVAIREHNNDISKLLMENGADVNVLGFLAVKSFLKSLDYRDCEGLVMTYLIAGGYIPQKPLVNDDSDSDDDSDYDDDYDYIVPEVQTVLMRCCKRYFMLFDHVGWERPELSYVHATYFDRSFYVLRQNYMSCYRDSLVQEVKEMKEKKIGRNTIYDVFAKFQNPTYVYNSQLEQAIKSPESEKEFPLYTSLLRITFTKAKPWKMLIERAMEVFKIPVPIVCRMEILSLLGNDDLENVITSFKKKKNKERNL